MTNEPGTIPNGELKAYQATPAGGLEYQIMSSLVPKNEREWWAQRTIATLREELAANEQILDAIYEAADGLPQDEQSTGKSRRYLTLPDQIKKLREELTQVKQQRDEFARILSLLEDK
jgi:hypothetical protein